MAVPPSPGKIPPRLTRQQFLYKRPKGNYQAYTNAYTRQHGGPPGPSAHGRPNQPFAGPSYESLLRGIRIETPAQLEARANRMANQGVTAQESIIREEAKRLRDEATLRMQSQAAAGRAAAAQNAGLFGMVGGEYNKAAAEIAGLGTNLSNQMVQTNEGQQLAADAGLAQVGAPAMAVGGPAGANTLAGPAQGQVSAYEYGVLPSQQIGTAGQAAQFGLAGMVSAQNLRATQEGIAGMNDSIREANANRLAAMKELAAGRPAQAAQFLQALTEANANARDQAMSLLAARQTFGLQNQANKRSTAGARQDRATAILNRQNARQAAKLAGRQIDEARSIATGWYTDAMGRMVLGKDGQPIKYKPVKIAQAKAAATNAMTPQETRAEMSRQMSYFLKDSYDKRGRLNRTKAQAISFMHQEFPALPMVQIRAFVGANWPSGATAGSSGGTFGGQPGK